MLPGRRRDEDGQVTAILIVVVLILDDREDSAWPSRLLPDSMDMTLVRQPVEGVAT